MEPYNYPDPNDKITLTYIPQLETGRCNYWTESEQFVLNCVAEQILKLDSDCRECMADIGCGEGRLISFFHSWFKKIDALEPDTERNAQTLKFLTESGLQDKVSLFHQTLENFHPGKQYGMVLCSHIIQHLHTSILDPFLIKIVELTKKNGLLVLTTCHAIEHEESFIKSFVENNQAIEQRISLEEFNYYTDKTGVLPVRFFFAPDLISKIEELGMQLIDFRVFHVQEFTRDAHDPTPVSDNEVNASPELQASHGRDMYLLFRKR